MGEEKVGEFAKMFMTNGQYHTVSIPILVDDLAADRI
jgi:hypothetical protein